MRSAIIASLIAAIASPAAGADCLQQHAVYADPSGYTLAFRPVAPEEELAVSNAFTVTLPSGTTTLDGVVTWGNGFSRPIGRLMFGCPDEPSEEEQETCTHWSGVIYGVDATEVGLLHASDEPAHDQLILANLGQVLNYSLFPMRVAEPIDDMPWDVFAFQGCQP